MDAYEKLVNTIRKESERSKQKQLYIAEMTGPGTCVLNGLALDADDFLVSDFLTGNLEAGDEVLACKIGDEYVLITKVVRLQCFQ